MMSFTRFMLDSLYGTTIPSELLVVIDSDEYRNIKVTRSRRNGDLTSEFELIADIPFNHEALLNFKKEYPAAFTYTAISPTIKEVKTPFLDWLKNYE